MLTEKSHWANLVVDSPECRRTPKWADQCEVVKFHGGTRKWGRREGLTLGQSQSETQSFRNWVRGRLRGRQNLGLVVGRGRFQGGWSGKQDRCCLQMVATDSVPLNRRWGHWVELTVIWVWRAGHLYFQLRASVGLRARINEEKGMAIINQLTNGGIT